MVSKASDDLPEPDSPVNTTSLSRGISTSMFFRLCSRAPRIVIARVAEPACWRFALITSSMSAIPGVVAAACVGARRQQGSCNRNPEGDMAVAHEQVIVFHANRPVRREAELETGSDRATPTGFARGVDHNTAEDSAVLVVGHRSAALDVPENVV